MSAGLESRPGATDRPTVRAAIAARGRSGRRSAAHPRRRSSARPGTSARSSSGCSRATRTSSSSGSSAAAASTTRSAASTPTSPTTGLVVDADAAARGCRLPGPSPRRRRGPRARTHRRRHRRHRPGARLPAARSGRLPALVRLRASAARPARRTPSTACPSSIAPSSRRSSTRRSRSSARPAAIRPRRSSPSRRWRAPGLIGDLVVDAKSGVSGAGREAKADLMFGEVNESVKAYGIGGHRHVAEIEQELAGIAATARASTRRQPGRGRRRLPAPPHPDDPRDPVGLPRPPDPTGDPGRARRRSTRTAYADEPFVTVVGDAAGDEARHRQQRGPRPRLASTSGPAGSSPSASRTTSSRAPRARRSRRSTSSTACPRRPASTQLPLAP